MRNVLRLVEPLPSLKTVPKKAHNIVEAMLALPAEPELDFDEITRLLGGSAANGDKNDPVVFQGKAERQMRQITLKYGFERLPFTYGELLGLLEYCDVLECITGRRSCPPAEQAMWQVGTFIVWGRTNPEVVPAARLYAQDDIAGLAKLHRVDDTLTKLGKAFREFEEDKI